MKLSEFSQYGNRCIDSMSSRQALVWNLGSCRFDVKGEVQVVNPQGESTNAKHNDGPSRSSDEVSVMEMERRGWLTPLGLSSQPFTMGGAG